VLIIFVFLSGGTMINSAQLSVTELKDISFRKSKINKMEIFLKIEDDVHHEIIDLNEPNKLAIEFSPIQTISVEPWYEIQDTDLLSVRVEKVQPEGARVILDFAERMPDYEIIPVEAGLIIVLSFEESFNMEYESKKIELPKETPAKIEEKVKKVVLEETPVRKKDPNYFLLVKAGIGKLRVPDIHAEFSFPLYGETAVLTEHYRLNQTFISEIVLGRRFTMNNINFKVNVGFSLWKVKNDGNFQISVPHPFVSNSIRTVDFAENNSHFLSSFHLAPGVKITTFEDLDFSDKSPFTSSDITITSKTFIEENFSSLWWGVTASIEYRVASPLSLLLETNYIKFSPKSTNLDQTIFLSRYQVFLGLQIYF